MAGSTISNTVTSTVTLGSSLYPSPLTVTGSGDVAVTAAGATGIFGPADSGTLINDGMVTGGAGSGKSSNGGTGVYLLGGSTAINAGTITGGAGGIYFYPGYPPYIGNGGAGVLLNGGRLTNSGVIAGGYGQYSGGDGVKVETGTLTNTGTIAGGDASPGVNLLFPHAGVGVELTTSGALFNDGTIIGGSGQYGGVGVDLKTGVSLTLGGVVIGGANAGNRHGAYGVHESIGVTLTITGTVIGGAGVGVEYGRPAGSAGVGMASGSVLTNTGTIIGGMGGGNSGGPGIGGQGVQASTGSTLVNLGFIAGGLGGVSGSDSGDGGDGVSLSSGAVTNDAGATIIGGAGGSAPIEMGYVGSGGAGARLSGGSLTNAGTILGGNGGASSPSPGVGGDNGGVGVRLTGGAVVNNTGSIDGGVGGYNTYAGPGGAGAWIVSSSTGGRLDNSGSITGGNGGDVAPGHTHAVFVGGGGNITGGVGAYIGSAGTLTNTGVIIAGAGIYVGSGGALINTYGRIAGGDGAVVASGGTLINSGTVISGVGVYLAAGATLDNSGTISGGVYAGVTADAVLFAAGGTLVVHPGASFVGQVVGNTSAADTLVLADFRGEQGTLSGIGTQFVDFSQITIAAHASWTVTGSNTIGSGDTLTELSRATLDDTGTLVNDGSIVLDPSTMTVAGLIGTGSTAIDAGSTLEVQGTIAAGQTIGFGGRGAYLHLDSPDSASGTVTNFAPGETIDLQGIDPASVGYSLGDLTFSGGEFPLEFVEGGRIVSHVSGDGTAITVALCFCANTQIMTPTGERAVQELAIGDLVTTHRGEARPIVWVGHGKVLATRGQRNAATPVIVRKGALGENVPNRDLRVTKGHAFWFDGVLIPVEFLVNNRLIEWDDHAQEVDLYHIELATHDVLLANGAAAESYRDDGNRWLFHNANSGWDLPPQVPCAPVLTGGPVVDAVWRRLLERAGPRPGFALTDYPDLHLIVDGKRLNVTERIGVAYVYHLSAAPSAVHIMSRAAAPAELGLSRDPRVLGVALRRLVVRQGARFKVTEANDNRLNDGFHAFEADNGFRWTDGDAALPAQLFAAFKGPLELVLHIGATARYLADEPAQRAA